MQVTKSSKGCILQSSVTEEKTLPTCLGLRGGRFAARAEDDCRGWGGMILEGWMSQSAGLHHMVSVMAVPTFSPLRVCNFQTCMHTVELF